jgi:sodium/proline symporter
VTSIVLSLVVNFVLEIGALYGFAPLPEGVVNGAFALALSTVVLIAVTLLTTRGQAADADGKAPAAQEAGQAARV